MVVRGTDFGRWRRHRFQSLEEAAVSVVGGGSDIFRRWRRLWLSEEAVALVVAV